MRRSSRLAVLLLAAIVLTLCATVASAKTYTGNDWLADFRSPDAGPKNFAYGYVRAIGDSTTGFCFPGGVTVGQVGEMLDKFLVEAPELRHHSTSALLQGLLQARFPCAKQPASTNPRSGGNT